MRPRILPTQSGHPPHVKTLSTCNICFEEVFIQKDSMNILSNNAKVISKHYFGRRHFGYELHEFILRSLEKLIDHPEDLLLGQLVIESLDELIHRPEVCLDLLLSVLVHAQLHLSGLAAVHEALDLAEVAHGSVVV